MSVDDRCRLVALAMNTTNTFARFFMRQILTSLLLFLIPLASVSAILPPEIRCIAYDESGNVILYWTPPVDTGEFVAYQVYYKASSIAPFVDIAQVTTYAQDSVLIGGTVFVGNVRFYMTASFNDGSGLDTSISSDTIAPMLITSVDNGARIDVTWNGIDLPSVDSIYNVFRRPLNGSWELFATTPFDSTYVPDTLFGCTDTYYYRVRIAGLGGCFSQSNVDRVISIDDTPPEPTELLCASVDTATGFVILEWLPSSSPDVFGYLLNYFPDFTWIDTTYDTVNLRFIYDTRNINGLIAPETLSVAPFDSCFNPVTNWFNQAPDLKRFSTLFGELVEIDRCAGEVTLQWNLPTEDHPVGVLSTSEYRIYAKGDDGISQLRGTVSAMDSVFIDTAVGLGQNYVYVIAAFDENSGKEALSNKIEVLLAAPDLPDYLYLSCVSGDHGTEESVVQIETDTTSDVTEYQLLRSMSRDGAYQVIQKIKDPRRASFGIRDAGGFSTQGSFFYIVEGLDECGSVIIASDTVRSVRLEGFLDTKDLLVNLEWNAYEGFDSSSTFVNDYELVRVTSRVDQEFLFTTIDPDIYQDDLTQLQNVGGDICYYVKVNESNENSIGLMESCVSNLLCFPQEPRVFIPNAFTPDGDNINDEFLPYVNYVEKSNYSLSIFDRAGKLVFSTNDPTQPWDGNGFAIGVYVYKMDIENVRGEEDSFSGSIHLIR